MIGAMPAIAVRGKGGKGEGSIGFMSRPHKLSLHFRPPLTHHQVTPTPSPVNSPPSLCPQREKAHHRFARIFLSKRCVFQFSVLAPLVGAILLFIGLIQLTPGAEASPYGIPLIISGSATLLVGLLVILLRVYFTWELNRLHLRRDVPQIKVNEPSMDQDVEKNGTQEEPLNPNPNSNARKNSAANTNLGDVTVNVNPQNQASPKAPPRAKAKDRDKDKAASAKLLKDAKSESQEDRATEEKAGKLPDKGT